MYLGQYLEPDFDVGPALTEKILKQIVRWYIVPPNSLFLLKL